MAAPSPTAPTVCLNTGHHMPRLGLGTFTQFKKGGVREAVKSAIGCGYRLIDCAWVYKTEEEVGDGIKDAIDSGLVKREDLFITTKLWSFFHEPDRVEPALKESLSFLKLDYLDLFLIHWPLALKEPADKSAWLLSPDLTSVDVDFVDTWKAMEKLVDNGLVRSIGISNFNISQIKRLLAADLKYKPANIQIEAHPYLTNDELISFCCDNGMTVTAFSPLAKGGAPYSGGTGPTPNVLEEPLVLDIAKKYGKTSAQVVLRWGLQRGYSLVPKSVTLQRIAENIQVFDFELSTEEVESISSLNKNRRIVTGGNFKNLAEYPF